MEIKDLVHEILISTTMHANASLAISNSENKNSDEMEQLNVKNEETMKLAEERLFEAIFTFRAHIIEEVKSLIPIPE